MIITQQIHDAIVSLGLHPLEVGRYIFFRRASKYGSAKYVTAPGDYYGIGWRPSKDDKRIVLGINNRRSRLAPTPPLDLTKDRVEAALWLTRAKGEVKRLADEAKQHEANKRNAAANVEENKKLFSDATGGIAADSFAHGTKVIVDAQGNFAGVEVRFHLYTPSGTVAGEQYIALRNLLINWKPAQA